MTEDKKPNEMVEKIKKLASNKIAIGIFAALLLGGAVFLAFSGFSPSGGGEKEYKVSKSSLPEVIASVDAVDITRDAFLRIIKGMSMQLQSMGQVLTEEKYEAIKNRVLENLTNTEVLFNEARKIGVKVSDKKVEETFVKLKEQYESEVLFKKDLKEQSFTEEELKTEIRKSFAVNKLLNGEVYSKVKITTAKAKEQYNQNKDKYKRPFMVKARHVFLELSPDADKAAEDATKAKMDDIVSELKKGEKFEVLAKKYSEGPSKEKGGDLGYFPRGAMVEEFEEVAFKMKPGDEPQVVRTRFGYHLIETLGFQKEAVQPFSEVKERIMRSLEIVERNRILTEYISGLREKADIKVFL